MKQEIIAGLIITAIALVMLLFPNIVFKITESWKNKNQDGPSRAYFIITRIVGAVFLVLGIVLAIVGICS